MADGRFRQIAPLMQSRACVEIKMPKDGGPASNGGKICGIDVGSTTCKYVLASPIRRSDLPGLRTPQHQAGGKFCNFCRVSRRSMA